MNDHQTGEAGIRTITEAARALAARAEAWRHSEVPEARLGITIILTMETPEEGATYTLSRTIIGAGAQPDTDAQPQPDRHPWRRMLLGLVLVFGMVVFVRWVVDSLHGTEDPWANNITAMLTCCWALCASITIALFGRP